MGANMQTCGFQSDGVNRQDERCFEPVQKVLQEFEEMQAVAISRIDTEHIKVNVNEENCWYYLKIMLV